jgi:hypothetical protein
MQGLVVGEDLEGGLGARLRVELDKGRVEGFSVPPAVPAPQLPDLTVENL